MRAPDAKTLGRLLRERIGATSSVHSTRTTIVLETIREESRLPLEISRPVLEEVLDV